MSRAFVAAACAALALAGTGGVRGQDTLSENQIKASILLNFARYVEWPATAFATAEAPLVFCMVGRDSKGFALAGLDGRTVGKRSVVVRAEVRGEEAQACHVAFIADSESRRVPLVLRAIGQRPVLTVSDIEGFIDAGGTIGLVLTESRLKFEVNREALNLQQLKASSHLLRLARNLTY